MTPAEARARVRDAGGEELVERLDHLDRVRAARPPAREVARLVAPAREDTFDTDVVFAGGGLSLLVAAILARCGARVTIVDRARVGAAHREWNASRRELDVLVAHGLVTSRELASLVVARYTSGTCRWAGGGDYPVHDVLDHAVDAGALLALARARAIAWGAVLIDGEEVVGHVSGPHGARVALRDRGGQARTITARLMVEARGAARPGPGPDLVCPTVGGVLEGLAEGDAPDEIDPTRGEILVTTEGVDEGRQHLWEAFPGRRGTTTVYLFYYAPAGGSSGLVPLYARFFSHLARYKRGAPRLVRPTFGYIPGWSRIGAPPAPEGPRIVLVGDAAARHSPLTFCGFGAMLRSLAIAPDVILRALDGDDRAVRAVHDTPLHGGTGALAALLASPPRGAPDAINRLLDAAFGVLHAMGDEAYAALLKDEMSARSFARFLFRTSRKLPRVYADVLRSLGPRNTLGWSRHVARALLGEARSAI